MEISLALGIALSLFLFALVLAALWLIHRSKSVGVSTDLVRIETRIEDQGRHLETRVQNMEHLLRELDGDLREGQASARQAIERRLGEAQTRQTEAAGDLRSHLLERLGTLQKAVTEQLADGRTHSVRSLGEFREQMGNSLSEHHTRFEQRVNDALRTLQETLQSGTQAVQRQVMEGMSRSSDELGKRVDGLTQSTDQRLREISAQVEKRLTEGFEKTTATFADVLKRLALIDEAQKKITELSSNVVNLQEVLADKRSRGAFGEVQLNALVRNVMPESSFSLQHTLSNGRVADCVLFLPKPTGNVAVDAKFPLESYQRMTDVTLSESDRRGAQRQFKHDIRRHIQDIADKYIVPGETSDGAVMFIPAEAVFAEIQAHHPDVVQMAQSARVWMVSPTTFMAILNTARAVLKDEATRQQVHIIQEHLHGLAKDFDRFQKRMDNLARHIHQANKDVDEVHVSARKITNRFDRIERVELENEGPSALEHEETIDRGDDDSPA